ncbi:MAG: hypothetical protein B5766_03700 [Candidatus Lumbricidophila eiseniae]|uniref:Bacterial Pleckstrin homology domain-containing protein n=1 Tax=Candidatus Lumbricidiphila eiseniae TaxID=1969409 RepID=A0A2A6FSM7_9MICO|nr:MAG: hypothetical protein B5766_03700 [Candidatus Lumbricidophila eiseniae]
MTTTRVYRTSNVYLPPVILVMFAVLTVGIPVMIFALLAADTAPSTPGYAIVVLAFTAVILGGACLSHHRLEFKDDAVRLIWFPAFRKTIPADSIISCAVKRANPWRNGLGLRLIGNSTLAIMNQGGDGVFFETVGNRRYLIVIRNPSELTETIRRLGTMIDKSEPNK